MGALLYLLSATVVAPPRVPSEPQIVTPESLPLSVNDSKYQPVNLNSTARPEILNGTGVEGYRNLLLPDIAGMRLLPLSPSLSPLNPLLSILLNSSASQRNKHE